MTTKTRAIAPEALEVLRSGVSLSDDGRRLVIARQLDRALYASVNAALDALGGKWDRKAKAHLFPTDVRALIADASGAGTVVDRKATLQFFPTPPALAARLVAMADIGPGDAVLEPSAGTGAILDGLPADARTTAVEIDPANAAVLRERFGRRAALAIVEGDFLAYASVTEERYDAVVMNPPFSRRQDIAHVSAAYGLLRPGGRLVGVVSEGPFFREGAADTAFRDWLTRVGATAEPLPSGAFATSGTAVPTRIVSLTR